MAISRRDPDDPWSRFFTALRERQADHTKEVMSGTLDDRTYAATAARCAEIDAIIEIARRIRRNEDINGREQTESVAALYDA